LFLIFVSLTTLSPSSLDLSLSIAVVRGAAGVVPECICMFTQLVVLVVMRCGVSGPFPFWADSLIFLQELNLSGNHLVGECFDGILPGIFACLPASYLTV
jgi:hypothetical protein